MRFPFRLKILAAFLALLGTVLAVSLLLVEHSQTARTEAEVRGALEVTRGVFLSLLERRQTQLATALRLMGGDFAFKQALSTADPATIESAAQNFRQRIGADALWVTDGEGRLYADTTRRMKPGRSLAKLPAVAAALREEPGTAVQVMMGKAYQVAAVPILAPDLIGVLAAGFAINDGVAFDLKKQTLSDVSFEALGPGGGLFASTLPPPAHKALLSARGSGLRLGEAAVAGAPGSRQLILAFDVSPELRAFIQRDWEEALKPLRRLERTLQLIGLAGFALALAVGLLIAGGVTASVRKLAEATRRLSEGDPEVRVDIRSRDEIGELGAAFNRMVEGLREKEKIRSVLRKAVSKEIADELLKRGEINLGGEERSITVLFSDIRSFTTISEELAPPELVAQLNAYFASMARAIDRSQGVIDKFVGDAIMALFGAPLSTPQDAGNALRAALRMVEALDELNAEREGRGLRPWHNGIGLNTGRAVAGTMGSEERWSYTVIGDSVNLASRLEGANKSYGTNIIIGES
ncbi:MAG: adenylate/guanylate cyclase domain-containing protein, partial [Elusimicrobiota bacterium]